MGKRVDVKTGFVCNNNCLFCVQADSKCKGIRSFDEIKKDLEDSRKRCDEVVLTGGEVTIRNDFLDIVKLAKDLKYKIIQIQTNGRMFSSMDFCVKTIQAGATEFAPAIHGYNKEQHDFLTRAPGSFDQVVKGIMNLKALNAHVLTNTVVVKQNYKDVPKIARLLVKIGVNQFQFAFVHPMGNALKNFNDVVPSISEAAPYIHKGLQIGIDAGKTVMAEAMPLCLMKEYENYISEKVIPMTEIRGAKHQNTNNFTNQRQRSGKTKFEQCRKCRYDSVCEGPWKEYADVKGGSEFNPVLEYAFVLKVAGFCNNRCRFCMVTEKEKEKGFMPLEKIKEEIDKNKWKTSSVDIFGGEPTMHPDFFDILEYAKEKGYKILLATNARMFANEGFAKKVKEIGVSDIRSSFHGHTKELQDHLSGTEGSFEQAVEGFKNIIKVGMPLKINIVINSKNINYLKEISDLLISIGIKRIKYSGLILSGNMGKKENYGLVVPFSQIKEKLLEVIPYVGGRVDEIWIEKLPFCLLPQYAENFVEESNPMDFIEIEKCKGCKFKGKCHGIWEGYTRHYDNIEESLE